ncbi:helix-turn-helix domain-containing protein [Microbacterium sp. NPDC089318]
MTTPKNGFVRLPNWLIDDADLTLHELAVYIVLLRFRDHTTGTCYPGMTTIADCARISRESVKRTIPKLEARGMIRVTKRKEGTKNLPNMYEVATADAKPQFVWESSRRGRRIPKRAPRDSETPPGSKSDEGRHSETLGRHSQTPGVGTPSASNKTYQNKTYEQDMTSTRTASGREMFTFDAVEDDRATDAQVNYLRDLAIHLQYESGGGVPDDLQLQRWRKLTQAEARTQIRAYLKALGHPETRIYPEPGSPEYDKLSAAGREFADTGGMPDSVFGYGGDTGERTA